jgi:PAS domain S-box-containing protein
LKEQRAYLLTKEAPAAAQIRVLLFEDNLGTARVISEMIDSIGPYQVEQVNCLERGLDYLRREEVNLILLDLGLPDSDGEETLIRVHRQSPDIPIIVITAHKPDELALRAVHLGAQDFLLKSEISRSSLGRAIHYALERHRAESSLRKSEHRFRAIAERLHDVIVLVGRDGRIIFASPSISHILGVSMDRVIGRNIFEGMHPDDKQGVIKGFVKILEEPGAILKVLCRYQHDDGGWRWLEGTARNWLNDSGIEAVVGVYRDVTERYEAEQALRQAYDLLEQRVVERTSELSTTNATLTEQVIERQRAEKILRSRNRQLAALNAITAAISRSLDLEIVLETLKKLLIEEVEIDAGCIYLYDTEEDVFNLRLSWGLGNDGLAACMRISNDTAVGGRGQTALTSTDDHSTERALGQSAGLNWLQVPLLFQGETRGILDLYRRAPAAFRAEEAQFFNILGQQVGVAFVNAQLFEEVKDGREQLKSVSRRLVEVREREQRDIARELHDEVGQLLTGLKMNLEITQQSIPGAPQAQLGEALKQIDHLLSEVRNLSLDLRPAMLDDFGLLPALLWLFERCESSTEVQVDFKHSGMFGRYATELETAVYRIVQEALTNVARHASVKHVVVRLWATPDSIGTQIEDKGAGFDPQLALRKGESSGLLGMRERATLLGGDLTIESVVGGGTCITAEFPLAEWARK